MCKHSPFQMDRVGKVAQCSWKGAQQVTFDHKSGFHNVPLAPESWEYFGLRWRGVYYVWTVLCFGWCASPYIYHSLSGAVVQHLRSQDVPTSAWLDGVWMTNSRDRPKECSPRDGGPRTHDLLPLRLLHGLSKMLPRTHNRPGLPGRRLRYGAT